MSMLRSTVGERLSGHTLAMRAIGIALLLLSCTAPSVVVPSPSTTATASSSPRPSASAAPSSRPDMTIAAAGEIRGDHALVLQVSQQPGGTTTAYRFWDVPLDGSATKLLLAYNRGEQLLTDFDYFDFSRQLSPDERQLILADPVDIAGTGLLVVDLIAGTTRKIPIGGGATQPAWSPDDQVIAYRGFTIAGPFQKETGIWVVPASSGSAQQVMTSDRPAGTGATSLYGWTEDGTGIAFARDSSEVSVVEIATGKITRVGGATQGIAWRPKRPSVAMVIDEQERTPNAARVGHVEVRETTMAAPKTVARYGPGEGTFFLAPRWNPRSDEILLLWAAGAGVLIRNELVVVDGVSAARRVLPTPATPRSAAWTADGRRIVYGDLTAIRVMNADGSDDHELFRPVLPAGAFQQFVSAVTAFAPR